MVRTPVLDSVDNPNGREMNVLDGVGEDACICVRGCVCVCVGTGLCLCC